MSQRCLHKKARSSSYGACPEFIYSIGSFSNYYPFSHQTDLQIHVFEKMKIISWFSRIRAVGKEKSLEKMSLYCNYLFN